MADPARIRVVRAVPQIVREAITILYRRDKQGSLVPFGTAFRLNYGESGCGTYELMVTARHVVTDAENGGFCDDLHVRANNAAGGTALFPLNNEEEVFFHPDPLVDVCVLPAIFPPGVRVAALSPEWFAEPQKLKAPELQEGLDVVFLGSFVPHPGQSKNLPIVRFGRIAAVPTEPIRWERDYLELVLVEAQCFPGNSGAPVFVFLREGARLLGVLKGGYTQPAVEVPVEETVWLHAMNGISAVVPAYLLEEMLKRNVLPALKKGNLG